MAPSITQWPGALWPPQRTVTPRPAARASRITAATSAALCTFAIACGLRSMAPFQILRPASYSACVGSMSCIGGSS